MALAAAALAGLVMLTMRDRRAALILQFGSDDVLLSTGDVPEPGVDARLYGAYAALDASDSDSLSRWRDVGQVTGCDLVERLGDHVEAFGPFVVARRPLRHRTTVAALSAGIRAYRVAAQLTPGTPDFAHLAGDYRSARGDARHPELCPG
ncbi:MAG TPA: hypothetical protein VM712_14260 [Gaiellales bacterium]|nr:hypothetical protein [Gaiellales bacterium]